MINEEFAQLGGFHFMKFVAVLLALFLLVPSSTLADNIDTGFVLTYDLFIERANQFLNKSDRFYTHVLEFSPFRKHKLIEKDGELVFSYTNNPGSIIIEGKVNRDTNQVTEVKATYSFIETTTGMKNNTEGLLAFILSGHKNPNSLKEWYDPLVSSSSKGRGNEYTINGYKRESSRMFSNPLKWTLSKANIQSKSDAIAP